MEKVAVKLPESHKDITLRQYLEFVALKKRDLNGEEFNRRKVKIFTNLSYKQTKDISVDDFAMAVNFIDAAIEKDYDFEKFFTLDGIQFGFHPDLASGMSTGEWIDLREYSKDDKDLHKMMAILFRPITNRDAFGNYEIEKYKGTHKYSELMKECPMHLVFGAIFFFKMLSGELLNHTLLSTKEGKQKREDEQKDSLKNGGGFQRFTKWLGVSRGKATR